MKWVVLVSLILANFIQEPTPLVKVRSGLVRGRVSEDGRFYQYFGIPYGTVEKSNRFQAPLPPPKWDGVLDAINENTRCPQRFIGSLVVGDEYCLKLNVYRPAKEHKDPYPVMVYIHGGCFMEGTGSAFLYGADYFVEHDVVFVGINYRLNVEGFLCLGIKEAPGNAGIRDQIAALKWIKDNIRAFGGDPDNVTVFGESAGAVSTSLLILSPAANGLFQKAIMQSGSSLSPWAIQNDPIKTASNLAKEFGYVSNNPYEIYDILSNKTAKELITAIKDSEHRNYVTATTLFVPCIEKEIPGVDPVINKFPTEVIQEDNYNKMPMIFGYNDNEGIYFVAKDFGNSLKNFDPKDLFQEDLQFPCDEIKNNVTKKMVKHYFSKNKDDMIMDMVDLYSDLHIKFPVIVESQLHAQTNNHPIFYYLFKYSGLNNYPKFISRFFFSPGASHADELFYLFKSRVIPLPTRYMEPEMTQRMVTLWTNFAKYSDPTPSISKLLPVRWRPSRASNPTALVIDKEISTALFWDEEDIRFWNETYTKYRRKDYGFRNRTRLCQC